jgi:hypothetical protein
MNGETGKYVAEWASAVATQFETYMDPLLGILKPSIARHWSTPVIMLEGNVVATILAVMRDAKMEAHLSYSVFVRYCEALKTNRDNFARSTFLNISADMGKDLLQMYSAA